MSVRHTRYLRERFCAIGVSKNLAGALAAQVSRWEVESGPLWTVNRLKMIKTAFLRRIAGETYTLQFIACRKDAQGAVPKGPFGVLWNLTSATDITSVSRALNAMMVYSTFMADFVTEGQWEKFHTSQQRAACPSGNTQLVVDQLLVPKWMKTDMTVELETVEQFVVRKSYTPKYVSDQLTQFIESDTGMALWENYPQYKQSFGSLADATDSRVAWDDWNCDHPALNPATTRDPVGTLGCTQEPGYKLRVFANPNICHQLAMSRLKRQLFQVLARTRWDCTYNQSNGTDWARVQLEQGRKIWSIDLSDATNNFPLEIQLHVLREIGCHEEDVQLFQCLARAPWRTTHKAKNEDLRWTVGQPLGLGPSFAAFALTHGILVYSLARANRVTDCFRVLGDDIIIADERVASQYLEMLAIMGIPISKDKTISSTTHAEFAGKVVTRDGILAALKWREPSDRSFLDVVRLLGPQSVGLLRSRQRKVANVISVLPSPEGFGWNPHGIPLKDRLQVLEIFNELTSEKARTYFPLQRGWNKVYFGLEQSYFKPSFSTYPEGSWWENPSGVASGKSGREPTPVGSGMHLLSISEMTGSTLKLPDTELNPYLVKELSKRGYTTLTKTTDPRGLSPLEDLESKITKLRFKLEQLGLIHLIS